MSSNTSNNFQVYYSNKREAYLRASIMRCIAEDSDSDEEWTDLDQAGYDAEMAHNSEIYNNMKAKDRDAAVLELLKEESERLDREIETTLQENLKMLNIQKIAAPFKSNIISKEELRNPKKVDLSKYRKGEK